MRAFESRSARYSFIASSLVATLWAIPGYASVITVNTSVGAGNDGCLSAGASGAAGPQSVDHSCVTPFGSSRGIAVGDYGSVGVFLQHFVSGQGRNQSGGASAAFVADGYVIDGPDASISTSLNLILGGHALLDCAGPGFGSCGVSLTMSVRAGSSFSFGSIFWNSDGSTGRQGLFDLGLLFHPDPQLILLTTPVFTVQTGVPFSVSMNLSTQGGVTNTGSILSDFGRTLTYNIGGPVFNLPDGYTANGLGVVNNRFGAAPVPMPEPASLWLMLAGSVGVWRARRRRTTRLSAAPPPSS